MKIGRTVERPELRLWRSTRLLALSIALLLAPAAAARGKLVVMLYPENNNGSPGSNLADQGLRSTFATSSAEPIDLYAEYLDVSHVRDADQLRLQIEYLRRKYAGRKVDLVIAGLSSGLDYALEHRADIFPGVPVVFCAVDEQEVKTRKLPPDVIGVPIKMDLDATFDVALRLHADTRRVYVVAGKSKMDTFWADEARLHFRRYEGRVDFTYLVGLPPDDLMRQVANLPERSLIYYLHVFLDGDGRVQVPAEVLTRMALVANAPIYGHVDTYVGRGVVGGRVFSFEAAGADAARVGVRILSGEKPESIGVQPATENAYLFDGRQLRRWGIGEENLPPGSVVRYKESGFWDLYKWPVIGVVALCVTQTLLISGLLIQRSYRRRAEAGLRELTGRLIVSQETERRRIARELHDDLSQNLALLSVDLDLLSQKSPEPDGQFRQRMREMLACVKQLSSSVHDLSHQLHPARLEQLGLVAAVRGLSNELTHGHGLPIEFSARDVPETISEDAALCLYRVAQEALQNAVKHSGARTARLAIKGTPGAIELRVADDGKGFDPAVAAGKDRLGLVSMAERLRLVGGTIAVDSRPGAGTRIDVRVPWPAAGPVERDGAAGAAQTNP